MMMLIMMTAQVKCPGNSKGCNQVCQQCSCLNFVPAVHFCDDDDDDDNDDDDDDDDDDDNKGCNQVCQQCCLYFVPYFHIHCTSIALLTQLSFEKSS